jgi:hypothetical protein
MRQINQAHLFSYILRYDSGFAPNPFGSACTALDEGLAVRSSVRHEGGAHVNSALTRSAPAAPNGRHSNVLVTTGSR